MLILIVFLSLFYFLLLLLLAVGILKLHPPEQSSHNKGISIIAAARNEEENIASLIDRIIKQEYPSDKYELLIVSDRSTDNTENIVKSYEAKNVKLLSIPARMKGQEAGGKSPVSVEIKGGKKRALALGVANAKNEILAFTDADCLPGSKWLQEINNHFKDDIDFTAGYSPLFSKRDNLLMKLKNFERASIFAVSAGSLGWNYGLTCTGRNIAYRKSLYEKVNGFKGIEDIPSGDDDLMLQRMTPYAKKMTFMFSKDSIVSSFDNKDTQGQINQETRRASKWRYYPLPVKTVTLLVFLYYLALFYLLVLVIGGLINVPLFLMLLLVKIAAEIVLTGTFLIKIKEAGQLIYFPLAELLHVPYFIFFALKGTFGGYKWK